MKKLKLILLSTVLSGMTCSAGAQISVNVNIGTPSRWLPIDRSEVRYYYLPDIESYYDVHSSMFIYLYDGRWIRRHNLPVRYKNYNLHHCHKVVIDNYQGDRPYIYCKSHKQKYGKRHTDYNRRNHEDRSEYKKSQSNRYDDQHSRRKINKGYSSDNDHANKDHKHGRR